MTPIFHFWGNFFSRISQMSSIIQHVYCLSQELYWFFGVLLRSSLLLVLVFLHFLKFIYWKVFIHRVLLLLWKNDLCYTPLNIIFRNICSPKTTRIRPAFSLYYRFEPFVLLKEFVLWQCCSSATWCNDYICSNFAVAYITFFDICNDNGTNSNIQP